MVLEETHMRKKAGEHLMLMQTQLFVRACVGPRSSSGDTDLQLLSHSLFMTRPHFSCFGTIETFFGELWKKQRGSQQCFWLTLEWRETLKQGWRAASTELGTFLGQDPKPLGRLGACWESGETLITWLDCFSEAYYPVVSQLLNVMIIQIFAECLSGIKHGRCMYECLWQISPGGVLFPPLQLLLQIRQ